MIDIASTLEEIESNYDVSKIKVNNIILWPYLRYLMADALLKEDEITRKKEKKNQLKIKYKKIKNLKYGFLNLFKPCEALFISTSKERKFLGDTSISKNINEIYKRYENAILIEHAFDNVHFDIKTVSEKNIVSLSFIEILSSLIRKIRLLKLKISGNEIISSINNKYGINFDLKSKNLEFISNYYIFRFLLKLKKPKILYISVWYGYGPVIKAAKDLGITTVEIQHGSFHEDHYSYNMKKIIDSTHYPDHILTLSQKYVDFLKREELQRNKIFNAVAVGSFLENTKKIPPINKNKFKEFEYIVCMSATINASKIEYDFITQLSNKLKKVLFIYLPRRENEFTSKKNLIIAKKFTASDYLPICDLHITGESTCMYEAAFFEKKTLIYTPFIELQSQKENFKTKLSKFPSIYRFIEDSDDIISIIRDELENGIINLNEIKAQNLYESGYNENITNFINKISK